MRAMAIAPSLRRGFHCVMLALALAACVFFAVHGVNAAHKPGGSDFAIYYDAGRAVLEGRDPGSMRPSASCVNPAEHSRE